MAAGTDAAITVLTFGDDCTSAERSDVHIDGSTITIEPFDRSTVDSLCTDVLYSYDHTVTVQPTETGVWSVIVLGYGTGDRFGTVIERRSEFHVE